MIKERLTKEEICWILYDVASISFSLIIVTTIMPLFFKFISSNELDKATSTSYWAFANTASSIIISILAPILGALSDYKNNKKKFFAFFLFIGLFFTFSFIFIKSGEWLKCIFLFIAANIGWNGVNIFYDSLIVDVTKNEKRDWISSLGFGLGYIGGVIPFLIVIFILIFVNNSKESLPLLQVKSSFIIVLVWWLIFSLPLLLKVKQKFYIEKSNKPIIDSIIRLMGTLKEISKYKTISMFLVSYFFFIDGIGTIIRMATIYGTDVGLSVNTLIIVILFIQIVAFPFSILFGTLAKIFSAKKMIISGIVVYILITFIAFFLPTLPSLKFKVYAFCFVAFLVATSQGGVQSLSRSLFSRLIPKEKSGEFFGFYNILGKFSVIIGPALMGISTKIFNDSKYGVLSILILFVIGITILTKVKE